MSKLLGGKLTLESVFQSNKGGGISPFQKRRYICARCQVTFDHYVGVKAMPGGLGLCKEHNPAMKEAA